MSRRFPVCSAKEVVKVLRRHDFAMAGQTGNHQKWRHENGRQVIVAMHGSKPMPIGTLKSIIDGSGLDVEEFRWLNLSFVAFARFQPHERRADHPSYGQGQFKAKILLKKPSSEAEPRTKIISTTDEHG